MYSRELYAVTYPADTWTDMTLDSAGVTTWSFLDPTRTLSCRFRVVARAQSAGTILSYACAEFEGSFMCYYDAGSSSLVIIPGSVTQTAVTALSNEADWDMQVTSTDEYLQIQCTQTAKEIIEEVHWEGYIDIVEVKISVVIPPP